MSGVFTSFGKLLFLKSGTIEGKKNFDCGFENFTLQGFNLNCKKGFEKENQIYKVYHIYNKEFDGKINNGLESGEWSCRASKRSLFVSDLEDR